VTASTRDLYLDLLVKTLANTVYGDSAIGAYLAPWVTPEEPAEFNAKLRETGLDWPQVAHTMVGVRRLENLRRLAQTAIDTNIPGDFIEAGVWRGGCCILLRGVLKANGITDRKVYAADSFGGMPPPSPRFVEDTGHDYSAIKALAVTQDEVRSNFARYDLLDDQVVFVEGLFQDTLTRLDAGPFAILRIDGDLYESTLVALETLYPKLSPGGFVIIDDYGGTPPCRQAVEDYRAGLGIDAPLTVIDWSGVFWQKPLHEEHRPRPERTTSADAAVQPETGPEATRPDAAGLSAGDAPVARRRPALSLVVVVYNIPREAPRTLLSLSASYQRHIDPADYEVIVVDNGSNPPFDPAILRSLSGNFRLLRIDPAPPSPAYAINRGIGAALGEVVGVMIDGARMVSPGLLHFALAGARLYDKAVVAAPGWYLGADYQNCSVPGGYDHAQEDALLQSINWPEDGYRLFEISTLDQSSIYGWLGPLGEASCLFLRREVWDELGGWEERFDVAGGGLLNLDTYLRAIELPEAQSVSLLGEGTFHQLHGGVATNSPLDRFIANFGVWHGQYERIRGHAFRAAVPKSPPTYLGTLPRPALLHALRDVLHPVPVLPPLLGKDFDPELWSLGPVVPGSNPVAAALIELAHKELRAGRWSAAAGVARLTRQRFPEEPEPQRLLTLTPAWLPPHDTPPFWIKDRERYFLALGEAHRILGEPEEAEANHRAALKIKPDLPDAHIALAYLRMPGTLYWEWIARLYAALMPSTVIEIGVFEGATLSRVPPPCIAIGIDPQPNIKCKFRTETHIFTETSDAFFARQGPATLLGNKPLGAGFIDGLHHFEQALRDFINLEAYCGPRSLILVHDTVPLDEVTQRRTPATTFNTGDVWKLVLCLKELRPDLEIFTIATAWSGLTLITGLDPSSRVLKDGYDGAVSKFMALPFSAIEDCMEASLNMVANDWTVVETRLKASGVL
jgi:hypothetical protein